MSKQGGKRIGSGRKAKAPAEKRTRKTFRLSADVMAILLTKKRKARLFVEDAVREKERRETSENSTEDPLAT